MTIHTAILAAMKEIASVGIGKDSRNKDQGYNFRGIEAAMNAMSPILIRSGITIASSYSDLSIQERESRSGGKLRFVTVKGSFRFIAEDGSFVTSEAYGEGMDSSDKATVKAQSVAYRTALFQQFVVPTMAIDPETGQGVATREDELQDIAMEAIQLYDQGKEVAAYEVVSAVTENEEKLYVWGLLKPHSALRAAIKRLGKADGKPDE